MSRARRVGRKSGAREPAMRIVIVTEGKNTEPSYLLAFHRIYGNNTVRLRPIGGVGDPRAVVDRAIAERNEARRDPLGRRDSFWAMFDRDDHPRFHEAVNLARGNDIPLAISNPCFELWGILHYEDQDAYIHRHDCQRRLGELCQGYLPRADKVFDDTDVIRGRYCEAKERGKRSLERRRQEGDPSGNPSSSVHHLTECIRFPFRKPKRK